MPDKPQWPEEGEDVEEIDPFTLAEGDRIYVKAYGRLVYCVILGPVTDNGARRSAEVVLPNSEGHDAKLFAHDKIVVGANYNYYAFLSSQPASTALLGITAIRIVRAKPADQPAACPTAQ